MFIKFLKLNRNLIIILFAGFLLVITSIIYINNDKDIYYVTKDESYPFKIYPEIIEKQVEADLKVYTKIVYPGMEDKDSYQIIDKSYTDGSELDIAEESLTFEYKKNIIEYDESDTLLIEAIELLDPEKPSSQTYGIYEKQPILVQTVLLDSEFNILDENFRDQFFQQEEEASVADTIEYEDVKSLLSKDLETKNEEFVIETINFEPLTMDNNFSPIIIDNEIVDLDVFAEKEEEDVFINMSENEVLISEIELAYNYPFPKPELLVPPSVESNIIDNFGFEGFNEPVEFTKSYYGVQVSSVSSRLEANKFYESLLYNYKNILSKNDQSHKNLVKQEDLGNLGLWYKLRIGPFDNRSEAKKLCSSLRDEGLDGCIVVELE